MKWRYTNAPILDVQDPKLELWPFISKIHVRRRSFKFGLGWHSYGDVIALDSSYHTKSLWGIFQSQMEERPCIWLSMDTKYDASYHIINIHTKGGVLLTRFVDMVDFLTDGVQLEHDPSAEIGLMDWLSEELSPSSDHSHVRSYRPPQAS